MKPQRELDVQMSENKLDIGTYWKTMCIQYMYQI